VEVAERPLAQLAPPAGPPAAPPAACPAASVAACAAAAAPLTAAAVTAVPHGRIPLPQLRRAPLPCLIDPSACPALPRPSRWPSGWTVAAVLGAALLTLPLAVIALGLLAPASATWSHVASTVLSDYMLNSARLVLGAGALALVVGVATAWLVTAYEFPGRRFFEWALILPLAVPAYIAAYTYAGMFDVTGPLQRLVRAAVPSLADEFLYLDVMNIGVVTLIFGFVLYPYVYLVARASFARQSATLLEAGRMLGRGPGATFLRVALPLARPALAAGVGLVAMEVLNDYGAVKYYGVSTFTTGIFRSWFALGDLSSAIRLSAMLMLLVLALLALERSQRGRGAFAGGQAGERPLLRARLGAGGAVLAVIVCTVPLLVGFAIPVAQLGYWAWSTAGSVVDLSFLRLVANTFLLAGAAAVLCVGVALLLTYAARLNPRAWLRRVTRATVLGYSMPGAVIAVGVLVPFAWLDHRVDGVMRSAFGIPTGLLLSGTLVALVFAYTVRFMAVAFLPVESGFTRICGRVDDAARSLGATPSCALRKVSLPLLRGTLLGAVILVFVDVLKELPLTLILRPFNFDTLATRAYQLATDELIAVSANYALVIIVAGIIPVVLLNRVVARRQS
jgi:iron(III) transport system permease protein